MGAPLARGPKVVCIDDQINNLRVRKLLLEQFGCEVIAVSDPFTGLSEISSSKPDIVLLDYHLANGVTGEEVARDIRAVLPRVPIVFLTGDPHLPKSAHESVDAVLVKGASSPADLLATIRRLVPDAFVKPVRPMMKPEDLAS